MDYLIFLVFAIVLIAGIWYFYSPKNLKKHVDNYWDKHGEEIKRLEEEWEKERKEEEKKEDLEK